MPFQRANNLSTRTNKVNASIKFAQQMRFVEDSISTIEEKIALLAAKKSEPDIISTINQSLNQMRSSIEEGKIQIFPTLKEGDTDYCCKWILNSNVLPVFASNMITPSPNKKRHVMNPKKVSHPSTNLPYPFEGSQYSPVEAMIILDADERNISHKMTAMVENAYVPVKLTALRANLLRHKST